MDLSQALRLVPTPPNLEISSSGTIIPASHISVAFVGAGGKTTALFQLAHRLNHGQASSKHGSGNRPVIVTATSHLGVDQLGLADSHIIAENPSDLAALDVGHNRIILVTGPICGDRTGAVNETVLSWLHAFCEQRNIPLLIEADGSRRHPLKAPAKHEPPIPDFVSTVVVMVGLSGLGKPLTEEYVHRPELFANLGGLSIGDSLTSDALLRYLIHPNGGLKNIPVHACRHVVLNQADTPELKAAAQILAENLLAAYQSVVIASLQQSQIHAVYEPIAGIILAGGEARRFGQPKQLLDYHGRSFVRAVTQTALSSGLSPVVVVTGAYANEVETSVRDLPVIIARNADWRNGQSSSIHYGIRSLPSRTGAAVFLLADQPQISTTVIRAILEKNRTERTDIIAPMVAGQRANPVLFDRVTFPDLTLLSGDSGGRAIFGKFQVTYLPWNDERLILDVDTPSDLIKLMESEP
jgi:molybdenum cofactor cytidylyltransferase